MGKLDLVFDPWMRVREQRPPLKVVRAFQNEDGASLVHLHNVSGGVLGGDCLSLSVAVGAGAAVQLTTTGATRIYRTQPTVPGAVQLNRFTVAEGGLLEIVPDALIPYAGARYTQETTIALAADAGLFWWEVLAPGRNGERFAYHEVTLKTEISAQIGTDSRLLAVEHLHLDPSTRKLASPLRLHQYGYSATLYVCRVGFTAAQWLAVEAELAALAFEISVPQHTLWGVSALTAHGVVIRAVSVEAPAIFKGLQRFWQAAKLRLYQREPIPPRKVE